MVKMKCRKIARRCLKIKSNLRLKSNKKLEMTTNGLRKTAKSLLKRRRCKKKEKKKKR